MLEVWSGALRVPFGSKPEALKWARWRIKEFKGPVVLRVNGEPVAVYQAGTTKAEDAETLARLKSGKKSSHKKAAPKNGAQKEKKKSTDKETAPKKAKKKA